MDASTISWRRSSYTGDNGGNCVELADLGSQIAIRDSKDPHGPALIIPKSALATFLTRIKAKTLIP